jgi:hypothetical protein
MSGVMSTMSGVVRGEELADRRVFGHVAFQLPHDSDEQASRRLADAPRDAAQREEDRRCSVARAHAQGQRLVEDPMLIAQVIEAKTQVICHPRIIVSGA